MRQVSPTTTPLIRPIPVMAIHVRHHFVEGEMIEGYPPWFAHCSSGRMAPPPTADGPILDIDLLQFEDEHYFQPKSSNKQPRTTPSLSIFPSGCIRPVPVTPAPARATPRRRRRVHFAPQDDDSSCDMDVQTDVHVLPPVDWTAQDREALWYSRDAIRLMSAMEKRALAEYTTIANNNTNDNDDDHHDHEEYVRRLLQVWSCPLPPSQLMLMQDIAHVPVRGMEKQVLPMMRQRRVTVVRRVLQAQQELREQRLQYEWELHYSYLQQGEYKQDYQSDDDDVDDQGQEGNDCLDIAHALRERYVPLTRTSVRFARALAEGDALAAAAVAASTT